MLNVNCSFWLRRNIPFLILGLLFLLHHVWYGLSYRSQRPLHNEDIQSLDYVMDTHESSDLRNNY